MNKTNFVRKCAMFCAAVLVTVLSHAAFAASSDMYLRIEDLDGKKVKEVKVDADGSFDISGLKAGKYVVKSRSQDSPAAIEVESFSWGVSNKISKSSDVSSGQRTGKRQHKPLTITKEWSVVVDELVVESDGSSFSGTVAKAKQGKTGKTK